MGKSKGRVLIQRHVNSPERACPRAKYAMWWMGVLAEIGGGDLTATWCMVCRVIKLVGQDE